MMGDSVANFLACLAFVVLIHTMGVIHKKIIGRCSYIEQQNLFANIREKRLFICYCDMKLEWAREAYTACSTGNENSGLAWFEIGVWKLIGTRKRFKKGRCPLYRGKEDALRMLCMYLEQGSGGNSF
jgi:hypothetical protein